MDLVRYFLATWLHIAPIPVSWAGLSQENTCHSYNSVGHSIHFLFVFRGKRCISNPKSLYVRMKWRNSCATSNEYELIL